jgi:hypothetical protein
MRITRISRERLDGYSEVPAVSSTGSGELRLRIVDGNAIEFELEYENLEGATTTASHAPRAEVRQWRRELLLCGGGGRPHVPASGSFTGTVPLRTSSDQQVKASRRWNSWKSCAHCAPVRCTNVHTDKHPGGEIRGQIAINALSRVGV